MQVDGNFKNFFAALKVYTRNPAKFTKRPRIPAYKDKQKGRGTLIYTLSAISKKLLSRGTIKLSGLDLQIHTQVQTNQVDQVRIIPKSNYYVVEVVYSVETSLAEELNKTHILGIDLGVDNLATLTSNQPGFTPLLVNGRVIKSINQRYNQRVARMRSCLVEPQSVSKQIQQIIFKRNMQIDHHLHCISRQIVDLMIDKKIGTLAIGKNDGWKQKVNIGTRNNQNFVQIPHSRLIKMLNYKAKLVGIEVIITEESYTSKCSFLDLEPIGKHVQYAGRRIRRAVFATSTGDKIHADVNGSYNIIRKVFPNAFDAGGIEASAVVPVRMKVRIN
jgi:IS605 OrfB family transposase